MRSALRAAEARRPDEQKLLLCMAIAYGGRQSIAQAAVATSPSRSKLCDLAARRD